MSTATCFQHYQNQRAMTTTSSSLLSMMRGRIPPASAISISVSATTAANEVSVSSSSAIDEHHHTITTAVKTYHEVNDLAFRALQRECKTLGLSAVGTTAALRQRLLEHFGLANPSGVEITVPAVTAAEIEVSFACFIAERWLCTSHYSPLYLT